MAKKHILSNCSGLKSIGVLFTLLAGCASIQQPQGGPRDLTPPKVVKMVPENETVNFAAKKVVIEFNEYFRLQNEFKEFSISPELEKPPVLKKKQRSLEITFPDTLEQNTTYTMNFGNAIADVNENNVIKNLSYVFSTGPELDSLSISGRVTNSLTGQPELDALAFIYPIERDTLLGKNKPSIYISTDSSGNYSLKNLRKGTYRLYAIKEKNGDKIYQQNIDEIAFLKDSIVLTDKNLDSMNLKLFKENASVMRVLDKKLNQDGSISIVINQKLKSPEVVVLEPSNLDVSKKIRWSKNNDSLSVWLPELNFDSTKIALREEGKLLQTIMLTRGKKDTYTRTLTAKDNLEGKLLPPGRHLKLTFNFPVERSDISKITLLEDSVARQNFTVEKDSTDLLSYYVKYPWKQKNTYDLAFKEGAFTGMFDTKNKAFDKSFELASKDEYGTLKVAITTPDKNKAYVLEIVNENKAVVNTIAVLQDTTISFNNYKEGKYFIRVIYDTNKNGMWDTGNISLRAQPEKIYNVPKELSIRANWERNETISIPKEEDAI